MREDILDEKVLSAIVEIKVPVERTEEIIRLVWEVEKQIDTVVALGVGTRCDEDGEENVVAPILEKLGYKLERAKTNIGLGRITNPVAAQPASGEVVRDDQHSASLRRRGEFSRRLRGFRHVPARARTTRTRCRSCGSFWRWRVPFKPVNLGDAIHGGALRPSQAHESDVALEARYRRRISRR